MPLGQVAVGYEHGAPRQLMGVRGLEDPVDVVEWVALDEGADLDLAVEHEIKRARINRLCVEAETQE